MTDFNKLIPTGNYQEGIVNTVIEIPMGSMNKIEYHRATGTFQLDRVEPSIFAKPTNYGFVPATIDEDGDELDTLVVAQEPLPTGIWLEGKILGVLNFEDDGEMDHKIILVPNDDRNNKINSLSELGEKWQQKIEHHFTHYKDLKKPGSTKVLGFGDPEDAKKIIEESISRYNSSNK